MRVCAGRAQAAIDSSVWLAVSVFEKRWLRSVLQLLHHRLLDVVKVVAQLQQAPLFMVLVCVIVLGDRRSSCKASCAVLTKSTISVGIAEVLPARGGATHRSKAILAESQLRAGAFYAWLSIHVLSSRQGLGRILVIGFFRLRLGDVVWIQSLPNHIVYIHELLLGWSIVVHFNVLVVVGLFAFINYEASTLLVDVYVLQDL